MSTLLADGANAALFAEQHGTDLRWVHDRRRWLVWDGKRWALDEVGAALNRARQTIASLHAEADRCADEEQAADLRLRARASDQWARLRALLRLAAAIPPLPVPSASLDADPWLLNLANGTFDLKENRLRDHRKADLITRLLPVAYKPEAACPAWHGFLERVVPDADVRAFLQRAAGCCLVGDTSVRRIFVLHGPGRNGKSLFLDTLRRLLADYAACTPGTMLTTHRRDGPLASEWARLRHARFVAVGEIAEGARLAEEVIKQVTGAATITACPRYGRAFEYRPEFKLWFAVNHKPPIRGTDDALWDRICLVPFGVRIEDDEEVPRWKMLTRFDAEAEGILAWLVEGCRQFLVQGLGVPDPVKTGTGEYRAEFDDLGTFLRERCDVGPRKSVRASEFYLEYHGWCVRAELPPVTQTEFGRQLTRRGFPARKRGGAMFRTGIDIHFDVLENA